MPDPKHARKSSRRWLVRLLYVAVLLIAGYGQATGIVALLGWPMWLAVPVVFVLELFAVVFASEAEDRRALGEAAYATFGLAVTFAGFAVAINWFGHAHADVLLAAFFAGLSAFGFVTYVVTSAAYRRDVLRAQGKMAAVPPIYGIVQWVTEPALTRRAKAIALGNRSLNDRTKSLAAAREEARVAARRRAIYDVVRADMDGAFGPQVAELVARVADPDRLGEEIERLVDWKAIAGTFAARVDPARLAKAVAAADQRREQAAAGGADGPMQKGYARPSRKRSAQPVQSGSAKPGRARARTTTAASTQAPVHTLRADAQPTSAQVAAQAAPHSPAPPARTGRAQVGAWPAAREDAYRDLYAPELNRTGQEASASRLAAVLGIDTSGATRARNGPMRDRYAREFLDGMQTPAEGVRLPPAVQERIAQVSADRTATGEFQRIAAHTPETTTGDSPA